MTVLLTGGAGYIGSHTAVELLNNGYDVIIADNFSNSVCEAVNRIEQITHKKIKLINADFTNETDVNNLFADNHVDAVIHFVGFKAVGVSVKEPLKYYENNVGSTIILLKYMLKYNTKHLVFSSSATVYHPNNPIPYIESMQTGCTNPYGWSKLMSEQIMTDTAAANPEMSVVLLRYFNPIGAHPSGLIGEDPKGIPNNLMPYITQVAVGRREFLSVYGNDYPTHDGTGVRDYIHICDLAEGHLAALNYCINNKGTEIFNLGTGQGYSVLDIVNAFQTANNLTIPYKIAERRPGDIAEFYADTSKANKVLGWKAKRTLEDMCKDSWNWQKNNPNGYKNE